MNPSILLASLVTACVVGVPRLLAADPAPATNAPAASVPASAIIPDEVVCKGQGIEVRRKELDGAVDQFKANAVARGQTVPDRMQAELEAALLDRLVITKMLLAKAVDEDRRKGQIQCSQFVSNVIAQAGSEAAFQRQLIALAFTRKEFEAQVEERAVCEEVIERELGSKVNVTDEQVKARYEENLDQLRRPEMVRASHILLSTKDMNSGTELTDAQKAEKKALATKLLARARKGEDFAALAKEFSEDPGSKDKGGEYVFPRGQMVKEFEESAFSLQTNQVSEIVTTQFGYHIIKLLQRIPAETVELAKVQDEIRKSIQAEEVQKKLLPEFLKQLRAKAKLEYLNGARPPAEPSETPEKAEPAPGGDTKG